MSRRARIGLVLLLLAVLAAVILARLITGGSPAREFTLDAYLGKVAAGEVASADVFERDGRVKGELTGGVSYEVSYGAEFADELTSQLLNAPNGITIRVDPQNTTSVLTIVLEILPYALFAAVFVVLVIQIAGNRGLGRIFGFGKTRGKLSEKERPDVTFKEVAGLEEAVEELQEIKEFLKAPDRFHRIGARMPRGVLLFGPPGTGKTLLARAVAGEAGVPFFSLSGSDFVEMFVGVGAARVRDLFKEAKSNAPCIVFLDEIDAVGRQRGAALGGGHDEREQTLNQLLVEMDGFVNETDVILIAATNRPDMLDSALLRPGRFDRRIPVDFPDLKGRRRILDVHTRNKPVSSSVDLDVVARQTVGFSGADLANVVNEAALLAGRYQHANIGRDEFAEAIERTLAGPERKTLVLTASERWVTAVHESGHALVGHALPNANSVLKVSVVSRGKTLGYTMALPDEDRVLMSKSEIEDQIAMLMGGRAAEEMLFGEPSSGGADDIKRATELARLMVCEYGMSSKLGPRHFGHENDEVLPGRDLAVGTELSQDLAAGIDSEISRVLADAHALAAEILAEHGGDVERMAERLLDVETLQGDALERLLADVPAWRYRAPTWMRRGSGAATDLNRSEPAEAAPAAQAGQAPNPPKS